MSNSLTCLLVSYFKIDVLPGNKFLQWRGNAIKPTVARELEDTFTGEERNLASHEGVNEGDIQ